MATLGGEPGITLDLNWSSLYGNFHEYLPLVNLIANVHIQTVLEGKVLRPTRGELDVGLALMQLRDAGYDGQYTLELGRPRSVDDFLRALVFISRILA